MMSKKPVDISTENTEPEARKYCTPEFVFTDVITWPYAVLYLVAVVAAIPAMLFFMIVIYGHFQYGGLSLTFGVWILCIMLILKAFSKTIIIYFDRKSIYIAGKDRNFKQYPESQVEGIYSYDYEQQLKSNISIVIKFKNAKSLYLTDAHPFGRKDEALMLRQFFIAAKKRLNLTYKSTNRLRSLQRLGDRWYTPGNNDALILNNQ